MKNKKWKKIGTALIPVAVFLFAAVVLVHGFLKSEPEAVPNPVQGISADSSLKGYLGTGFAYAGSKEDAKGEENSGEQEQAQLLPEATPSPTVTPEPTKEPEPQTVTPTPKPEESVTPTPQATVTETPPENNNNTDQNQENQRNTIEYDNQDDKDDFDQPSKDTDADDNRSQDGAKVPDEDQPPVTQAPEEPQITETPAPTESPEEPVEDNYPKIATDLTDGDTVNASYRTFYIQATDHYGNSLGAAALTVTGNGERLSCQGEPAAGILAYRLELAEGANTIEIKATDEEGYATTLPAFTLYKGEDAGPQVAGSITISIEAGTVGLGTILPATSIEYYQGEQLSSVLLRLLQNTGFDWRNNGDATSGFYLKAIGRGGISANAAIPDDLMAHLQEVNCQLSDHDSNWLGEFDFTMDSGWLYSVNGEYMSVGMSSYFPADGDEVRLRFSLYSGADVGGGVNGETWGDW